MEPSSYTLRAKRSNPILRGDCFVPLAITLCLCLSAFISFSQTKNFRSLSKYEKRWAFFHPCAACKIKKHQREMYSIYNEVKKQNILDTFSNGGKLDAFRHAFAMAYFSKYVSVKKLRKLGKAHEKGNYLQFIKGKTEDGELPDSLSSVMDLKNNEVGFALGGRVKNLSAEEIKQKVFEQIQLGNALIINRNTKGDYVDCSGNILSPEKLKGTWNIPKCLVASNK